MTAFTVEDIRQLLEQAPEGTTHVLIICDTFDWEDFPVYVSPQEVVHDVYAKYHNDANYRVMEVYNMKLPIDEQVQPGKRVFNF